jgi:hypothetical protein
MYRVHLCIAVMSFTSPTHPIEVMMTLTHAEDKLWVMQRSAPA